MHEFNKLLVTVRVRGWVRVMVEFGTSSASRGWVGVRVLGYGFGVRGRKVKSRDCALAPSLSVCSYRGPLFVHHFGPL